MMNDETTDPVAEPAAPPEEWGLCEIMGHRRHYGRIAEVTRFGVVMLQVDVPNATHDGFERFYYGAQAIFAVTPCSEEDARIGADRMRPKPWVPYQRPALSAPADWSDEDEIGAANEPVPDDDEPEVVADPKQDSMEF